jgi:glycosyltransferase involved in cell wall biosynthesis
VRAFAADIPIICDEHNDELALKGSIIPDNSAGRWLLRHVDRIERTAVEHAALVTATTDLDLDTLGARYRIGAPTAVVPNGVDTTEIEFVAGGDRRRRRLALAQDVELDPRRPAALFVGSGHGPNIDAGRAIIEVAREVPDIDFLLAGRHSSLLNVRHLPPNVRVLGPVSDDLLDLLLSACDLALNPMSAGSGSNLKLLTYLAAGLPVVSTIVGARGIDADAAGVATVPLAELAAGIRDVVRHDNTDRSLAGRHYVEEHCDWRAIGRRFAALTAEHIDS